MIDSGWREQSKKLCKGALRRRVSAMRQFCFDFILFIIVFESDVIKKRGMDITVEELISEISEPANNNVPKEVKDDLFLQIQTFLNAAVKEEQKN